MSDVIYASYNGSQLGVTVRNTALVQQSFVNLGININDVAAGSDDDFFITSANVIAHYKANGTLITQMTFPIASINYTSISVKGDRVYASYNGSQQGFTVRDMNLNQLSFTQTGFDISGIAAGPTGTVFLTSGNNIYHYKENGGLITQMTFPIKTINYTSVSYHCGTVYASYNGSQLGFTVRNVGLVQQSFANIGIDIASIAAGTNDDVFLAAQNHLYHYKDDGTLITDMTFPIASINYNGISGAFATLT